MSQSTVSKLPLRVRFLHHLARFCLRLLTRLEVHGADNVPTSGSTLLCLNHLHWTDPVIALAVIERPAMMFTAEKWERAPVLGALFRWTQRVIFVQRGEADRAALAEALRVLERGEMLGIAPEGTRSKTGALQQAHDGPAFLATRTGATLVPMTAVGQEQAERCWKRLRRPHIVVHVGEPFRFVGAPNKVRSRDLAPYTEEIMRQLVALLPAPYHGVYSALASSPPITPVVPATAGVASVEAPRQAASLVS